jgi:flagellar biosynthetic protein FliQ
MLLMTDSDVLDIALQTMVVALKLSVPVLLPALAIGFVISLFQSMTQIQEFTLAFVPKLIGVGLSLLVSGNWMLHTLIDYTNDLFTRIPGLLG